MTISGDSLNDLVRLRELFALFGGDGPVVGDFLGDLAETEDGEFLGEFALHLMDLVSDLGEGHGGASILLLFRRVLSTKGHE